MDAWNKVKEGVDYNELTPGAQSELLKYFKGLTMNEKAEVNGVYKQQHLAKVAAGNHDPDYEDEAPELWEEWDVAGDGRRLVHQRFHHDSWYKKKGDKAPQTLLNIWAAVAKNKPARSSEEEAAAKKKRIESVKKQVFKQLGGV